MSKDTSKPAFPFERAGYSGMTLRDYFAAKAMQGICAQQETWGLQVKGITAAAYEIADAMLEARGK